jgi:hypothetical protein
MTVTLIVGMAMVICPATSMFAWIVTTLIWNLGNNIVHISHTRNWPDDAEVWTKGLRITDSVWLPLHIAVLTSISCLISSYTVYNLFIISFSWLSFFPNWVDDDNQMIWLWRQQFLKYNFFYLFQLKKLEECNIR